MESFVNSRPMNLTSMDDSVLLDDVMANPFGRTTSTPRRPLDGLRTRFNKSELPHFPCVEKLPISFLDTTGTDIQHLNLAHFSHLSYLEHHHRTSDTISNSPPPTTSFSPPFEFSAHSVTQKEKLKEDNKPDSPGALDLRIHRGPEESSKTNLSENPKGCAHLTGPELTTTAFNIQNILGNGTLHAKEGKLLDSNQSMELNSAFSGQTEAIFFAISSLLQVLDQRRARSQQLREHPSPDLQNPLHQSANLSSHNEQQSFTHKWLLEQQWCKQSFQPNSDSGVSGASATTPVIADRCGSYDCSELSSSITHNSGPPQPIPYNRFNTLTTGLDTTADSVDDDANGKGPAIFYHPEPADSKNRIRMMIEKKDPRLKYVNDGAAIRNPFALDRKVQLAYLTSLLCVRTETGDYLCKGCDRTTSRLRPMQQHLLSHSSSKFNLCVRCLKGFNDKYDMKRHTRKHTMVRPYVCPECCRSFSQRCSLEGHRRKIHKVQLNFSRNQRREVVRVCESCGFSCTDSAKMLQHTVNFHPNSSCLPRLKRQLIRQIERNRRSAQPRHGASQSVGVEKSISELTSDRCTSNFSKQLNETRQIPFEDTFESENPDNLNSFASENGIDTSYSSDTTTSVSVVN